MKKVGLSKSFIWTIVGALFIAGASFAWNTVWHGTDWIQSGAVIDAQKIAENFEFLYQRAGKLPVSCPNAGDVLSWDGNQWVCGQGATAGGDSVCSNPNTTLENGNGTSKTVADCEAAGGVAIFADSQTGCVCKFGGSSCPAGWVSNGWSETRSNNCYSQNRFCSQPTGCTTPGHTFSRNMSIETCQLIYYQYVGDDFGCLRKQKACYAIRSSIGCK